MAKRRRLVKISTISDNISTREEDQIDMETQTDRIIDDVHETTAGHDILPVNNGTPREEGEEEESDGNGDTSGNTRGPTILTDVWNQPKDEKWVVKWNKYGQPLGDEAALLASFIGTLGRNPEMAPQGYKDWRLVPREYKNRCLDEVKARFTLPRRGRKYVRTAIGKRVRDFRGELKAEYYEKNKHDRTALVNNKHPRVPIDQWLKLLSYWDHEKTKKRANINRNNQRNQTMPHCAGRKSFARIRAEKTKDGVEPSRAEVFIETHKDRKQGKKIDEESARAVESMKVKLAELPGGTERARGKIAWKGDVYDQVINKGERHGKVRGVGLGIYPTKLWDRSCSNSRDNDVTSDDSEIVPKLLERMQLMEEKHAEEMRAMQEKRDLELKKVMEKQTRVEAQLSTLLELLTERASQQGGNGGNSSKGVVPAG